MTVQPLQHLVNLVDSLYVHVHAGFALKHMPEIRKLSAHGTFEVAGLDGGSQYQTRPGDSTSVHSLPGLKTAKAEFLQQYGKQYGYSGWLDKNWDHEVQYRFGSSLKHYLDFTGAALYTRTHMREAHELLQHHTFSNPHSTNPSSRAAERQMQDARKIVLKFFNASEDIYTVVWTR